MRRITPVTKVPDLGYLQLDAQHIYYQLQPDELTKLAVARKEGILTETGVLSVRTGKFTGRSPKDRFIVKDKLTTNRVCWNDVNIPMSEKHFDKLYNKVKMYLKGCSLYVRDSSLCANKDYQLRVRTITETAYQNLFAHNLFIEPDSVFPTNPEWTIIAVPGFLADAQQDGTRQQNFSAICFSRRIVLIGGTGYTGEIKKAMFSVLNFLLPFRNVLPMHCAANKGADNRTAIFFGLSGTGKTTLSADPDRFLIGDDEHGWSDDSIFNFEGGCYAKTAGLTAETEPSIYHAIKPGALLENIVFKAGNNTPDFTNLSITENTRVSYPLDHLEQAVRPSVGTAPTDIFFLTADAFGVLPPIARLNTDQAMYYFLSGYTSKIAGTEMGIVEPQATFSACFGKAFLPLHASEYATLLGKKLHAGNINVWLVNTGWVSGPYGTGERIKLAYTRALVKAALNGDLNHNNYKPHETFGIMIPEHCPGVPTNILNPATSWSDLHSYFEHSCELAVLFRQNFRQFYQYVDQKMIAAGPTCSLVPA